MSQMKKIALVKSKVFPTRTGKTSKKIGNNLSNKLNVNEEYKAAFRTQSYLDMWSKVQSQLIKTDFDRLQSSPSLSSSLHLYMHLSEQLLEPRQETLADIIKTINLHHLLIEYFQASLEACNICELLLQSIHQMRANYKIIKSVIKLTRRMSDSVDYTDVQCRIIYRKLAKFASLRNPLSVITPVQFHEIHDSYKLLLHKMTSKCKRVRRRARLTRFCKRVAGLSLVTSCSALAIVLLVILTHGIVGIVGIVAAPVIVASSRGPFKRIKLASKGLETSLLERLGGQLDAAAKGLYILLNDLDTMSRLVGRLHDEIEHRKAIAKVCVRNVKGEVLKQVVKEFQMHEPCFMEQLEELEEHVYLCFLTISRSRSLVVQEIMVPT